MVVIKVVDEDVAGKIDTQYIEAQYASLQNIAIVYICTVEGGEDDEWVDESGMRHLVIQLPHKEVEQMKDARAMMLAKAKERLGI